jgi:hypothetical protein
LHSYEGPAVIKPEKPELKLYEFEIPKKTIHERIEEIRKNIHSHYYTDKKEC